MAFGGGGGGGNENPAHSATVPAPLWKEWLSSVRTWYLCVFSPRNYYERSDVCDQQ